MYVLYNTEACSHNHCRRGRVKCITHSERVVAALFTQHAKLMGLILLQFVTCPALQYFPHSIS